MAKLIVERNSEFNNSARKIGIYINDKKVGTLNDGERREYEIEQGKHEVYAKIDWCRSKRIKLDIAEGEIKTIKLSGFKHGGLAFIVTLASVLLFLFFKEAFSVELYFLLAFASVGFLYPMYYTTIGRKKYLVLTTK